MKKPEGFLEWVIVIGVLWGGFDFGMLAAGHHWSLGLSGVVMFITALANVINAETFKRRQAAIQKLRESVLYIDADLKQAEEARRLWRERFGVHTSER